MVIIASVVFLIGFEIGPGPFTYVVMSEIFPKQLKTQLISATFTLMWVTNVVLILTFPFFENFVYVAYGLYFLITLTAGIGLCFTLPETKGKSLLQIENEVTRIKSLTMSKS